MAKHTNILSVGLQTVPEIRTPISLPMNGTIPSYLASKTLYRVGPGRYDVNHSDGKPHRIDHWFDGLSLLHSFNIDSDAACVHYRNRFLVDDLVDAIEQVPSTSWKQFSFGNFDPCRSTLSRLFQLLVPAVASSKVPDHKPNIGVTLQHIPGKGVTVRSDMAYNHVLNEEKLEVDEFFGFSALNSQLKGAISAAHGHFDATTNEFFNYTYDMTGRGKVKYNVFKVNSEGKTKILATIEHQPVYIHSFATTENYIVLMAWPLHINPLRALWTRSIARAWTFHKDLGTTFYVISRHGEGLVKKLTSDAFFCFHNVNSFEKDGKIHIDLSRYDDAEFVDELYLDKLRKLSKFSPSTVTRFTIPLESGNDKIIEEVLSQHDIELPRVHPQYSRKEYTFAYGVSSDVNPFDSVAKVDVVRGRRIVWSNPKAVVGEPIFVPDPAGTNEDDGCVLVVVLDSESKTSSMVVLDARDLTEIGRAEVPQVVPLGFHGMVKDQLSG